MENIPASSSVSSSLEGVVCAQPTTRTALQALNEAMKDGKRRFEMEMQLSSELGHYQATLRIYSPADAPQAALTIMSETFIKKRDAEQDAALKWVQLEGVSLEIPTLPRKKDQEKTEDEILFMFRTVPGFTRVDIVLEENKDDKKMIMVGIIDFKDLNSGEVVNLREEIPIRKSHNQCRKEIAQRLLRKLYVLHNSDDRNDPRWNYYYMLRPECYIHGYMIPREVVEENEEIEFKGETNPEKSLEAKDLFNPTWLAKTNPLKTIAAFLNGSGGSMYIGIHDCGQVQGIRVSQKDRDNNTLLIHNLIRSHLQPLSLKHIKVIWHKVLDELEGLSPKSATTATTHVVPIPPPPPPPPPPVDHILRPKKFNECLKSLSEDDRKYIIELENFANQKKITNTETELFVLEIHVLPHPSLHLWQNIAYYRNGNQTVKMPIPILEAKVIKSYLAQQKTF